MTLKEVLVGFTTSLAASIVYAHFRGEKEALILLGALVIAMLISYFFFYFRGLVIHYAGHGIGPDQYADVTTLLRGYIRDNKLNVPIDGTIFLHDPYRGERKHVWVQYSYRSRVKLEKVRHDGDRLMLP